MASRGVNKVILVGNLGANPETRYMPSGGAVTSFTVATKEVWKDKQTGQPQERTEWHRVVIFGRLAEIAGEYLKKGSKAYLEGSLRTRKWQDQQGQDRWTTEIVASEMQMLDSRGADQGGGDMYNQYDNFQNQSHNQSQNPSAGGQMGGEQGMGQQSYASSPSQAPQANPGGGARTPAPAVESSTAAADDFDDDIPF